MKFFALSLLPLVSLITSASADILDLNLDLGLLRGGSLVTLDAFAGLLSDGDCPTSNVAVRASVLGLVRACVCASILQPAPTETVCPDCPANASPVCGDGRCACQCDAGFYADGSGLGCLPTDGCQGSGGTLDSNGDGTYTCTCPMNTYLNSAGTCVLAPSQRARRRNLVLASANQSPSVPFTSGGVTRPSSHYCPEDGETACPLSSGGFECVDTSSSLLSCGGCVGAGGENCLAIPGALGVACRAGACEVSSCFRGYDLVDGKCV